MIALDVGARAQPATRTDVRRVRRRSPMLAVGIAALVVYCLAPIYWMLVSSLRRTSDIFSLSPWPTTLSFASYATVFDPALGFVRAIANSVIVAGVTTALALLIGITTAYAIARLQFRFKQLLLTAIIATSMFPSVVQVVPLMRFFSQIGWINTYQGLVVPTLSFALPFAVWNLTTFFRQMPDDLEAAAMVDGCTRGQAFRLVILPVAAPGVITTAIITFFGAWNEFLVAVTLTNRSEMATATVAVSRFSGNSVYEVPFGPQMAAGLVVTIPLIVLVVVFQRRIVAGLAAGAEK